MMLNGWFGHLEAWKILVAVWVALGAVMLITVAIIASVISRNEMEKRTKEMHNNMMRLFRKYFRLIKWLYLKVSKPNVDISISASGVKPPLSAQDILQHRVWFWLLAAVGLILLTLLWISACTSFPAWRDQALRDVAEGQWHVDPVQVPASGTPSQTIEFYDAGGKHLGYGKVQGGTTEFFNVDGSRAGFGRR